MIRRPPRPNRTDPSFPSTTLFRSLLEQVLQLRSGDPDVLPGTGHLQQHRPDRWRRIEPLPDGARLPVASLAGAVLHRHGHRGNPEARRSEEHTSELQSLMRISYAVFGLKKKNTNRLPHVTIQ